MLKVSLFLCGCFFALSACSGDDDEPAQTRAGFCQEWAKAACSPETVSACQAANADECAAAQNTFCLGLVPDDFADDRADACIRAVRDAYEDADLSADEILTVLRLGPPCDKVVRGERDEGESCSSTRDCNAPGGYECVIKGDATMGTCQIPEGVQGGYECAAEQQTCADRTRFYCNGQNCVTFKTEGAACSNQEECGPEAYCAPDSTCTARLAVNSPCMSDIECLSGVCFTYGNGDQVCTDTMRLARSEPHCDTLR